MITYQKILEAVSAETGISIAEIRSDTRVRSVVRARALAYMLCSSLTRMSGVDMGRRTGGRDHSTVLAAKHRWPSYIEDEPALEDVRVHLIRLLQAQDAISPVNHLAEYEDLLAQHLAATKRDEEQRRQALIWQHEALLQLRHKPPEEDIRTTELRCDREEVRWFANNNERFVAAMRAAHPEREVEPGDGWHPRVMAPASTVREVSVCQF